MSTFAEILREHARRTPQAPALSFEAQTLSFAQLHGRSSRAANALVALGVRRGDRVAVLAKNRPEFFELIFACSQIGAILVGLNWRLAASEIEAIWGDAQPRLVVCEDEFRRLLPSGARESAVVFGSGYDALRDRAPGYDAGYVGAPDETILLLYTSGTTGLPKGVMLTNEGMSYTRRLAAEAWGMGCQSVNLVAMPVFHIGGCGYGSSTMMVGGHTVLMREVNPAKAVELIAAHRVTHAFFVPTVVQALLQVEGVETADLSSLQLLMYGASPIGDVLLRRALERFKCRFMQAYGMTESAGTVVVLNPWDHDLDGPRAGLLKACGRALPWVELRVVDPATLADAPTGEVGEIWLRTRMMTKGYWRKPEATTEAITADGWFRTGDAAYLDDAGYVFLFDRFKDMIVSGGENVYPAEIENVLNAHPAIREVGVIGAPHEKWIETPMAVVVLKPGEAADEKALIAFTRERLAHFKCPTRVRFAESLPRNASGKLLKREMRRLFLEE
ncbi:MAG: long-chain-fatty-acid--CoA ligase [Pseudomonadota bacterium]|nr:long-chain-fatty-acid--CoA ligase [Pseudomonadota bacterium]